MHTWKSTHSFPRLPPPVLAALVLVFLLVGCAPTTTSSGGGTAATPTQPSTQRADLSPLCSSASQPVTIADAALWPAVMRSLGLSREATTVACSDLARLRTVQTSGVRDLVGLEYAVNLFELKLEDSPVASLEPINGLERLETLEVSGGSLTSIDTLRSVPRLTILNLKDNALTDLAGIERFPRIVHLVASGNAITDVTSIGALSELYWLELDDNQIADITPLASLSRLSVLKLNRNAVTDAGALADLPNLGWLEMSGNRLTDTDFLANLNLRVLRLADNRITSVRGLSTNRSLGAEQPYDLRGNCIDLASDDPFVQDLLARGTSLLLEPQDDCSAG